MDPIRIALIGCGGNARGKARIVAQRDDARFVGLCDVDRRITETFAEEHLPGTEGLAHHTDPERMLADLAPDAVCICSPHTLHFPQAMLALDHGCEVFVEKPMVTDSAQAYQLRDRARELGRRVLIGYNGSCQGELAALRQALREETLGPLHMITAHLAQNWLGIARGTWRQQRSLSGGGQAYDSGAHLFGSLMWALERPVQSVMAMIECRDIEVDVNTAIAARFEGDVLASIGINGDCPANDGRASFLCRDGRIDINLWRASDLRMIRAHSARDREDVTPELPAPRTTTFDHFIDVLHGRTQPATTPEHGILHSELMDLIYASAESGRIAHASELRRPQPA